MSLMTKFGTNCLVTLKLASKKIKIPVHVDPAILSTNCEGLARPPNLVLRGLEKIKLPMDIAIHQHLYLVYFQSGCLVSLDSV